MAIYSITNTFSANTLIQSAQVNANFTEISTAINTTLFSGTGNSLLTTKGGTGLTSYTTGDVLYASASNTLSKLAAGTNGQVLTQGASIPSWVAAPTANNSYLLLNLGLSVTQAGGDITVALKQADGSTAPGAAAAAVQIGFRDVTATSGAYNLRSITAANNLTIAGATTLGAASAAVATVYIYAVDNSGTITLGASLNAYDEGTVRSTSTTATSNGVLYQASALTSKPIRLIGRFVATNTAGAWGNPTEVSTAPFAAKQPMCFYTNGAASLTTSYSVMTCATKATDTHNFYSTSTGLATLPAAGKYVISGKYNAAIAANYYIAIYQAGAAVSETFHDNTGGATLTVSICETLNCAAGDTIGIYGKLSTGSGSLSGVSTLMNNISIVKVAD